MLWFTFRCDRPEEICDWEYHESATGNLSAMRCGSATESPRLSGVRFGLRDRLERRGGRAAPRFTRRQFRSRAIREGRIRGGEERDSPARHSDDLVDCGDRAFAGLVILFPAALVAQGRRAFLSGDL